MRVDGEVRGVVGQAERVAEARVVAGVGVRGAHRQHRRRRGGVLAHGALGFGHVILKQKFYPFFLQKVIRIPNL